MLLPLLLLPHAAADTDPGPGAGSGGPLHAAIQHYNSARTRDGKGLTIPSQLRYAAYYDTSLQQQEGRGAGLDVGHPRPLQTDSVAKMKAGVRAPGTGLGTSPEQQVWGGDMGICLQPLQQDLATGAGAGWLQPCHRIQLSMIQIRNLPAWILQSCTVCVFYRPAGLHKAMLLAHVHVQLGGKKGRGLPLCATCGCRGSSPPAVAAASPMAVAAAESSKGRGARACGSSMAGVSPGTLKAGLDPSESVPAGRGAAAWVSSDGELLLSCEGVTVAAGSAAGGLGVEEAGLLDGDIKIQVWDGVGG